MAEMFYRGSVFKRQGTLVGFYRASYWNNTAGGGVVEKLYRSVLEGIASAPAELAVRRIVAEALGDAHLTDIKLTREVFEAITEPFLTRLQVNRAAVEAVYALPPTLLDLRRLVVEAIAEMPYIPPMIVTDMTRAAIEVIGYQANYLGRFTTLDRSVAEVVVSAASMHRGFDLPDVEIQDATIWAAMTLDYASGSGTVALVGAAEAGLTLNWVGTNPSVVSVQWQAGAKRLVRTVTAPVGKFLLWVEVDSVAGTLACRINGGAAAVSAANPALVAVNLTDLGQYRAVDAPSSMELAEIQVYPRIVTSPERTLLTNYATTKWL
jgi:hypothetical protein